MGRRFVEWWLCFTPEERLEIGSIVWPRIHQLEQLVFFDHQDVLERVKKQVEAARYYYEKHPSRTGQTYEWVRDGLPVWEAILKKLEAEPCPPKT